MANTWFRMYAEFATDPKVQMMSEVLQRRLTMLFCLKCCNANATLSDEQIAFQLRISEADWQETKCLFIEKNFIDSDNNIVNWAKRQYLSSPSTERSRRYRAKKKLKEQRKRNSSAALQQRDGNISETTDTDTDTDTDTEKRNNHKESSAGTLPRAREENSSAAPQRNSNFGFASKRPKQRVANPVLRPPTDSPQDFNEWIELVTNRCGYDFHVCRKPGIIEMFLGWMDGGVTIEMACRAMDFADAKRGEIPNGPAYYAPFVQEEIRRRDAKIAGSLNGYQQPGKVTGYQGVIE